MNKVIRNVFIATLVVGWFIGASMLYKNFEDRTELAKVTAEDKSALIIGATKDDDALDLSYYDLSLENVPKKELAKTLEELPLSAMSKQNLVQNQIERIDNSSTTTVDKLWITAGIVLLSGLLVIVIQYIKHKIK